MEFRHPHRFYEKDNLLLKEEEISGNLVIQSQIQVKGLIEDQDPDLRREMLKSRRKCFKIRSFCKEVTLRVERRRGNLLKRRDRKMERKEQESSLKKI